MRSTFLKSGLVALGAALLPGVALAENDGVPHPWQVWLLPPQSPVDIQLDAFMGLLLWIITADRAVRARRCWSTPAGGSAEKRNPVPSRRSHNTLLEIVWTAVPVLILVIIAIPSFKLLYFMDVVPEDRADASRRPATSGTGATSTRTTATSPSTPT